MISSSYFFIPYVTFYSLLYSKGTGEARLSSEKKSEKGGDVLDIFSF
jgi:hypothetical protein